MKAAFTWTCCWCQISSRRFECQSPSSPPHSWTKRSHVHLQRRQRCPIRPRGGSAGVIWGHVGDGRVPGLHSSPCCSFSPAYTSMHQAWKAKEKRSSKREGGRTTTFRRFSHSWHCSKVENWHLEIKCKGQPKQSSIIEYFTFYLKYYPLFVSQNSLNSRHNTITWSMLL